MVNPELIDAARKLPRLRILVTGGSGFVGSHTARAFAAGGHEVTASARNPFAVSFHADNVQFLRGDLCDPQVAMEACRDRDLVIHAAALASPWASRESLQQANVRATEHVVRACQTQNVKRFVHVSSTAIHFDYRDAFLLTEDAPLAHPFACEYARTKAEAEVVVRQAAEAGLNAIILRARAVFGPGDNTLLPRLLQAADTGRLRRIGTDETKTDLTYIDNFVLALIRAAATSSTGTFTITNDEPVKLWPFLGRFLKAAGRPPVQRSVPRKLALAMIGFNETLHRVGMKSGEPELTRYSAGLLCTSKTFDISAARRELGYSPIVPVQEALDRTVRALTRKDDSHATATVSVRFFTTGYTTARAHHAEFGADRRQVVRFHALIALIEHPVHGRTLFDTGYSPRFFEATSNWPCSLYRRATPVVTSPALAADISLASAGIDPASIRRIVLSHLHADHTCGLLDFPHADIVVTERCWQQAAGLTGWQAVRQAVLPDLLPKGAHPSRPLPSETPEHQLCLIRQFHGPGLGPFESSHDLFGDGSVRLLDLSGHAAGQCGVLLQTGASDRMLLVADSAWTSKTLREGLPLTLPFRLLAHSVREAKQTCVRLHELHQQYPDIDIIPTHCPEIAERFDFDSVVDRAVEDFVVPADRGGDST